MWFLEHESLFGGKRIWLRPGTQQLFGRTKASGEGKTWKIDNKAVSRQHVIIKVLDVAPDVGTKLHTRSQVEITDLSCRQGTVIDGRQNLKSRKNDDGSMEYARVILDGTQHEIRLAQSYEPFKVTWKPLVFTYASKESKESKARSARLHALDFKTTTDFIFGKTTHVVSQKRNLPRVLSGLVAGKHIVTEEFLEAVIERATSTQDSEFGYVPSPLEESYDDQWPKEEEYTPPTATEPVPRPQEMLRPDVSRSEVFSNLTFVFLDEKQHSSLQDPIAGGGGKALLYDLKHGETSVQQYVDYVRSVAGKKKGSRANNDKLPVITVRLPIAADSSEEWAANFLNGVDRALNQRSIFQNEFLDIVITKDRATLQQSPDNVPEVAPGAPQAATRQSFQYTSAVNALPEASETSLPTNEPLKSNPRKRIHRPKTTSRFTGFDDYEPPPKVRKIEDTQMEDVKQSLPQSARMATQASGTATTPTTQTQTQNRTQGRFAPPSPPHETVEKEEQMDSLFPAAAEIKRRRAATRAPSASVEPETSTPVTQPRKRGVEALENLQRVRQKADKDINVREHTRLRMQEEEKRRQADEESLREQLEGIDIEAMKNLAVIEEIEVLPRAQRNGDNLRTPAEARAQARSDRWNPAWNGRKNFKKFRRRGAEKGLVSHKVIVPLEAAPPQQGFSDSAFFLDVIEPRPIGLARRQRRDAVNESESEPETGFRGRKSRAQSQRQTQSTREVIDVEDSGPDDEEVIEVRTQKSSGRTQRVVETQASEPAGRKRAGSAASGPPAAKRSRVVSRDDDSDDEETGFRLKRR
ncbi:DNA damage response protein RcaA [Boeremia exigua]|uniref:DNA damage response protein RcaA n=1 Tax=Boeremia exigua TaxID=749465 RepID=UPI001E8E2C1C|nr:DNA damage response protein RcaA [Boeremia exigua]KAH6620498.1 DNA damage response protein RcaA [Boeremia exigua]